MNVLIGLFVVGCVGLVSMVVSTGNTTIGGGLLLVCALLAGGLNVLRAIASSSRSALARRQGLGLFGVGLVASTAFGAALGSSAWRALAAAAEEKRLAEEHRIEELISRAPTISPILDAAQEQLEHGNLLSGSAELSRGEDRLRELRGYAARSPLIGQLDQRLKVLIERHHVEQERVALASVHAAEQVAGIPGLEAMLTARRSLSGLPSLSAEGRSAQAALDEKISKSVHQLGSLAQPVAVLEAHLLSNPPKKSESTYRLGHLPGAQGFVEVAAGKIATLYLVAEPRSVSLSNSAATAFVELTVGPLPAAPVWKAPPGAGPRTSTRTHNGVPIHEGWFDARLVELWAGDFKP